MSLRRFGLATAALGLATALIAPSAMAGTTPGERSLAAVLTSDGNTFDRNWYDYDLVTEAVLAVLEENPDSAVGVLTDGSVPLTAFIPNDRAFQVLVRDLTKRWYTSESRVFSALVDAVGVDGVEQVLLYHVVPGATLTKKDAVAANGAVLPTAQGGTITVKVYDRSVPIVVLRDKDTDDVNPFLNPRALDINAGNKQIAHGIVFVLRPFNLP
ncbi:fasciclin domain-containing protein [uncultured Phycicoccus sp.]|uniref:fasciclin domain-containing protein n=1 Tax=uncultured Phycicoccus sp. TaxID=661422 RepID=UPI00261A7811|nr:fasciclin domain-containing protein [uncultured Phycicoccus sp.]